MSKLLEVAKAIGDRMGQFPCTDLDCARAAIEALREPTEWMVGDNDCAEQPGHAREIWQNMIDAILSEPQTSSKPLPSLEGQGPEITQDQIDVMERGRASIGLHKVLK